MVYGWIAVTLFCLTAKGYSGKRVSGYVSRASDSFLFTLLRMVFCILIGAFLVVLEGSSSYLLPEAGMLFICALAGIVNAAFLVGWLAAVQKNAMVSVDVGMTLGSLLPALLCALLFGEAISLPKLLGFALVLVATVILAGREKQKKEASRLGILFLVLAALGDGLTGFVQQLYRQLYTEGGSFTHGVFYPKSIYHFYTYVFTALVLLAVLLVQWIRTQKATHDISEEGLSEPRKALPLRVVWHVFLMAVCLFAANYLQTVITANYGMSSQILFPLLKGGCLITVSFVAAIFFGERITKRTVLGVLVALAGIVSMNLL